jgi:short-subunit dehydrogenase
MKKNIRHNSYKKALVIGGTKKFGLEVSHNLTLRGFEVITVGRTGNPDFICDIGNLEQWQSTLNVIKSTHPIFDLIVFIVGYARGIFEKDLTGNDWIEHLNRNVVYVALGIEALKENVLKSIDAKIVTIGSQWSYKICSSELVPYLISKHALKVLTRDFASRNPSIKANHYCVPTMDTAGFKEVKKSFAHLRKDFSPKRVAAPKAIAESLVNHVLTNKQIGQTFAIDSDALVSQLI